MADIPIIMTKEGLLPVPPAVLQQLLIASVTKVRPGYTANLPGSLVEDISSTDVGALKMIDSARIETVNSLTPFGANQFLLNQLGAIYGVAHGVATNTSVFVTFSGPPGFVIGKGFTVSDGTHAYIVRDGGIIRDDGQTQPLFAVADQTGTWAVPPNTVTQLVTSVPTGYDVTVTNLTTGTPGGEIETEQAYRSRVLQAGLAASQGMQRYLRTMLGRVEGVQARLVGIRQHDPPNGGWSVISGGGDPYATAQAIALGLFDISSLLGSTLRATAITAANPAVVTTDLTHDYTLIGQDIQIEGSDPAGYDGDYQVLDIVDKHTFKLGKPFLPQDFTSLTWLADVATANTAVDHGITEGSTFTVIGADPLAYNGTKVAVSGTTGSILKWAQVGDPGATVDPGGVAAGIANFDTTGFAAYVGDGVITPSLRNREVSLDDYPDLYIVRYIDPPQQTVTMTVQWNTVSTNLISEAAVASAASMALADYINDVNVGLPLNVFEMIRVFQEAVADILASWLISELDFIVSIDGIVTPATPGTGLIEGDPESFFFAQATGINVVQA